MVDEAGADQGDEARGGAPRGPGEAHEGEGADGAEGEQRRAAPEQAGARYSPVGGVTGGGDRESGGEEQIEAEADREALAPQAWIGAVAGQGARLRSPGGHGGDPGAMVVGC